MKVNTSMSVLFWLNMNKADESGKAPIYCRITITGIRAQFSTSKKIEKEFWDNKAAKVDKKHPDSSEINEDLESLKGDLRRIYNQLAAINQHVSPEMVRNTYTGKGNEIKTIMDIFQLQLVKVEKAVASKKAALNTKQRWQNLHRKLKAFLKKEYNLSDKPLIEIKPSFADDLREFFSIDCNLSDNVTFKYISLIKQLLNFAVDKGWVEKNPITKYKCPYRNPHRQVLTMMELTTMMETVMPQPHLERSRDIYIFSCFTGYAYKEVKSLTPCNLIIGMDGNKWISLDRHKTNEPELVPLLPVALQIIYKYKDDPWSIAHGRLLPVISNQKYNKNLKKIAELCGIKKHLTTHTARHTFATTVTLEHDVPLETVSKLLGHRSIRSTQIYAKISLKKLSDNMNQLRDKLTSKISGQNMGSVLQTSGG